jgi:hypothetical protein
MAFDRAASIEEMMTAPAGSKHKKLAIIAPVGALI